MKTNETKAVKACAKLYTQKSFRQSSEFEQLAAIAAIGKEFGIGTKPHGGYSD